MITREWSDWNNGWYWWIQSVYVMPEYRGKGIFKAMYTKVIEMAKEQNIAQVRLYVDRHNTNAQKIYPRQQFFETLTNFNKSILADMI